ncbi:MAG: recombination mediator RecR [Synergistetes bacterium]|nr:recombination mediator RecR [Synergistota bacterium]MCX8127372.1 recombination mediator RecR [Synergistota bacterium]MDW8192236.1 recombination mediator RecR [Synergistota bacterium]
MVLAKSLRELVVLLSELPGLGEKSSQRIVFHLLKEKPEKIRRIAELLIDVRERLKPCSICGALSDTDPCGICLDKGRDKSTICVVEDTLDLLSIERASFYKGVYHVLGGLISFADGIGPEDLNFQGLIRRLENANVKEIILALDPSVEGDTTMFYIVDLLKPFKIRITRLAFGIPIGGNVDMADSLTLTKAFEGRREIEGV